VTATESSSPKLVDVTTTAILIAGHKRLREHDDGSRILGGPRYGTLPLKTFKNSNKWSVVNVA
jgi:hypothetical protein